MWWVITLICLSIFTSLLFVGLYIDIDSTKNIYRIRFSNLISAQLVFPRQTIHLEIRIVLWKRNYDLMRIGKNKNKSSRDKADIENPVQKYSGEKVFRLMRALIISFKIRKCTIMIDTGNMPLNGILFPWFYLFSRRINKTVMINFTGNNSVILQLENSLARMLWAYFKS
jgi:hypothetical protein